MFIPRVSRPAAIAIMCLAAAPLVLRAQKKPEVADVLKVAADYLDQFAQKASGLLADESYTQRSTIGGQATGSRQLKSQVFMVSLGGGAWAGYRDSYEADGRAIHPREDRLLNLFTHADTDTLAQAMRLAEASASHNLMPEPVELSIPTLALMFLAREHQDQSTFKLDGVKAVAGVQVATLKFTEAKKPRLLQSADDAAVTGRFWIEVDSGRVRQTELMRTTAGADQKVAVTYGAQPKLDVWVPLTMNETYSGGGGGYATDVQRTNALATSALDTQADYTNYRAAPVDLSKIRH